ncbi:MAG: gluconate 2-dehydrogenase subunit 3 family protein [Bryobacteraceae bacterium]
MHRRTVLQILPAMALPAQLAHAADLCAANGGSRFENYAYAFFSAEEAELTSRLMEIIIPADANSPGAREARTAAFADLMLSTGTDDARRRWREGLSLFRQRTSLEAAVAEAAQEEEAPKTDLGRFFVALKRMTVDGYYTSAVGIHQDLKYQGNDHLTASPKCDHPEHKSTR